MSGADLGPVAVVVPARAAAASLPSTLAAVLASPQDVVGEVAVAVAPDDAATRAVVREHAARDARVRLVDNPGGGTAAGLNAAIAATTAEVVVRVDAHAVVPAGYLARCREVLAETGAGNVGGVQWPVGDGAWQRAIAAAMRSPVGSGGAAYRRSGEPGPVDTVYLGAFRRSALDDVGGYDEALVRNQDYELNVRLRAAGHEVWFDPSLWVRYAPREDLVALASQYAQYGRWKRRVLRAHPSSAKLRQLAAPALVVGLVAGAGLAAGGRRKPLVALLGAWAGAIGAGANLAGGGGEPAPKSPSEPTTLDHRLRVAAALATQHVAWGLGFLRPSVLARP